MFGLHVSEAAALCGGSVSVLPETDQEITRVVIDSREVTPGCMFVAYRGEKTDGHRFIDLALQAGAACALAEEIPEGVSGPVIVCENVQHALEMIISAFRERLTIPIVGITGSVGKTTAKEMVSSVLAQHFNVHKTAGNKNNTIGLPLTLSGIDQEHEIAVLELGINHFGEMDELGAVAKPNVMLFTKIGHAHLEFLHDLDGVFQAKTEVLSHMNEEAPVIYNGDDPYLCRLAARNNSLSFGTGKNCMVYAENIVFYPDGITECDICYGKRKLHAVIHAFGEHMGYAALEGAAAGFLFGLSDEEIKRGIEKYKTVGRRFSCIDTGMVHLIDDCYNANPDSVMSSIQSLCALPGRHVCILGDMRELGDNAPEMHRKVGSFAHEQNVDELFVCGELCKNTALGFGERAKIFPDKPSLIHALPFLLKKDDVVLVKASLGSKFAEVSDFLKVWGKPCLFLDIDNTVLDFSTAEEKSLLQALFEAGLPATKEILAHFRKINIERWELLEKGILTRNEVLYGRFEVLFAQEGISADAHAVQDRYEELLCSQFYYMPGAIELLEALYGHYRMFIASNGNAVTQDKRIALSGIGKYFENVFVSERVGAQKPSKDFYYACFQSIPGFDPSRAVMIGDSLTSDIRGGLNAGIQTVWYNPENHPLPEQGIPDYSIAHLSELPELLKQIFTDKE